jgi:uracil phosphoribosyltransferase
MLATGGSASCCIEKLIESGVKAEAIVFINLICCPKGIERILSDHPGVRIITASIDDGMNHSKYISPGLGDFGDRFFGSKLP